MSPDWRNKVNKRFTAEGPFRRRDNLYFTVFDKQTKQVIAMPTRKGEAISLANELEREWWKEVTEGTVDHGE